MMYVTMNINSAPGTEWRHIGHFIFTPQLCTAKGSIVEENNSYKYCGRKNTYRKLYSHKSKLKSFILVLIVSVNLEVFRYYLSMVSNCQSHKMASLDNLGRSDTTSSMTISQQILIFGMHFYYEKRTAYDMHQ